MEELRQAFLARLHAAQFFRREYAQLCTEMTLRLSPMCAFHRFPSLAEISSFESVQLSLAQSEKSVHFAPCLPFFQAPLHRCGLLVFSPVDCFSPRSRGAFSWVPDYNPRVQKKKRSAGTRFLGFGPETYPPNAYFRPRASWVFAPGGTYPTTLAPHAPERKETNDNVFCNILADIPNFCKILLKLLI